MKPCNWVLATLSQNSTVDSTLGYTWHYLEILWFNGLMLVLPLNKYTVIFHDWNWRWDHRAKWLDINLSVQEFLYSGGKAKDKKDRKLCLENISPIMLMQQGIVSDRF